MLVGNVDYFIECYKHIPNKDIFIMIKNRNYSICYKIYSNSCDSKQFKKGISRSWSKNDACDCVLSFCLFKIN